MIRHIVFFSVADASDKDTVFAGLNLLRDIPSLQHFEVGQNERLDQIGGEEPDFVVYAEFATTADFEAYKAHPLYQKSIEIVRPLREMRIAADYTV